MKREDLRMSEKFTAKHIFSNDVSYLKNSLAQVKFQI